MTCRCELVWVVLHQPTVRMLSCMHMGPPFTSLHFTLLRESHVTCLRKLFFFFLKWVKELRQKSVIIYLSTCVCVHVQSVLPLSRDKRISSLSTSQTPTLWFRCCSIYLAVHAFACLTVRWSKGKGQRGSCGETVANYLQHRRNPRNIDFQLAEPGLLRQ